MDNIKKAILKTYKQMKKDGIIKKSLPILFTCKGGKIGGQCTSIRGNNNIFTPLYISIDLIHDFEPSYILLHEVSHQIQIEKNNNKGHDKRFKNTLNKLIKTYGY